MFSCFSAESSRFESQLFLMMSSNDFHQAILIFFLIKQLSLRLKMKGTREKETHENDPQFMEGSN